MTCAQFRKLLNNRTLLPTSANIDNIHGKLKYKRYHSVLALLLASKVNVAIHLLKALFSYLENDLCKSTL